MGTLVGIVITGVGATLLMDLWGRLRQVLFDIKVPDYGLVGRWIGHMPEGRFLHASITMAAPVKGERQLGWIFHYLTGVAFAALLPAIWGSTWLQQPAIVPALMVGLGTVAAPFLLMQPAMGAGIAAARTPRPGAARMQSLLNHAVFGLGLYAAGWGSRFLLQ